MQHRLLLFFLCSLTLPTFVCAQQEEVEPGVELQLSMDYMRQRDANATVFKVGLDYFVNRNFSINWYVAAGGADRFDYARITGGLRLAGWSFENIAPDYDEDDGYECDCDDFYEDCDCDCDSELLGSAIALSVVSSLLPSTLAVHLYPSESLRLSPYLSPASYTYARAADGDKRFLWSSVAGVKLALGGVEDLKLFVDVGLERIHDSGKYTAFSGAGISIPL